jgi:DNA-binding NarL/FixJ family response regulator
MVVEDQVMVRQGLCALLASAPGVQVVAEAGDGEEALRLLAAAAPDVLLLDVRMPRCGGVELLRRLRAQGAVPSTLVLTTFDDEEELLELLALGARGYLLKDVPFSQLLEALRTVAAGGSLVRPVSTARLGRTHAPPPAAPPLPEAMTPKEMQVLRLMSGGFDNHQIARALGLVHGTVKNHVSVILAKLGVKDRTRAVLKALEQGLL